jgi:Arc/MetJ family transcription regulator
MKRMTLMLDQALLAEAMREFKTETNSATVQYALEAFVQWKKPEREMQFKIDRSEKLRRARKKALKKKSS